MPLPARSEAELTDLFRRLGARDPEGWARSRASITATERDPDAPLAGVGAALVRMLAAGVDRDDITALARGMQYETASSLLHLLGDPTMAWNDAPRELRAELEPVTWAVIGEVGDGRVQDIESLHEDLLTLDPTGREMRPREAKR